MNYMSGKIEKIDEDLMLETSLYEIKIDRITLENESRGIPKKITNQSPRSYGSPSIFTVFKINGIHESINKTMKILSLEDGYVMFLPSKEIQETWQGIDVGKDNEAYSKVKIGLWILSSAKRDNGYFAHCLLDMPAKDIQQMLEYWEGFDRPYGEERPSVLTVELVKTRYRKWKIEKDYENYKEMLRRREEQEAIAKDFKIEVIEHLGAMPRATHFIKIQVHAVDGNDYYFEFEGINWESNSWRADTMRLKEWHELVFKPEGQSNLNDYVGCKIEQYLKSLVRDCNYFVFGVNKEKINVLVKSSPDKTKDDTIVRRFYLNGEFCPQDLIVKLLNQLRTKTVKDILAQTKIVKEIPDEAQKMIDNGLKGEFYDLEGTHVFKMDVLRRGRNYFLVLNGKEYGVDGGFSKLIPLQTSLNGKTNSSGEMYKMGISGCRDFKWILFRLGEIVGKENAMNILIEMKKPKP